MSTPAPLLRPGRASAWLDHLPALYREGPGEAQPNFLGRFLLAFEHLLHGVGDPAEPGLDEVLDGIATYFDPAAAPPEFLDWLSGWVALTLRGDLDAGADGSNRRETVRTLIASAVPLYRLRGTRRGLQELIRIYTGGLSPTITELTSSFQIGVTSRLSGADTPIDSTAAETLLDGGAPHFFLVRLRLPQPSPAARARYEEIARAILELEKPAHTRYALTVETPELQVGVHSQVGVDTLVHAEPTAPPEP